MMFKKFLNKGFLNKKNIPFKKIGDLVELQNKAIEIRRDIIKMLLKAGSGHSAGPLDLADIFTALYFNVLNHSPQNPKWDQRDRLCLSCGHVVPVMYVSMAHCGYFPIKELDTFRKINSRLQGHPSFVDLPMLEHSAGPLGQGSSVAVGKALIAKLESKKHFVFCVLSDGEHQEGQVWEAIMFAGKHKLNNLIFIIDRNNIQIEGNTEDVMPIEPLRKKYEAFNWHVIDIDGHNMRQIIDSLELAKTIFEKPTCIIAHTIPGKGVDFMEYKVEWHGKPPNKEQAKIALKQLRTLNSQIKSECE